MLKKLPFHCCKLFSTATVLTSILVHLSNIPSNRNSTPKTKFHSRLQTQKYTPYSPSPPMNGNNPTWKYDLEFYIKPKILPKNPSNSKFKTIPSSYITLHRGLQGQKQRGLYLLIQKHSINLLSIFS